MYRYYLYYFLYKNKTKIMSEEVQKFYELDQDTINLVTDIIDNMAIPFNIKIKYVGVSKQKQLIKLQKVSDALSYLTNIDLIIYMNDDYVTTLDEQAVKILIHQELDRLEFDMNKGTFKIGKYPLQTTEGVLMKYGIEAVSRANQLSQAYTEQSDDREQFEQAVSNIENKNKTKSVEFLD